MVYTFLEHKNRFASWCGASAAGKSPKCRFKVSQGAALIKKVRLCRDVENIAWENIKGGFDQWHSDRCESLMQTATDYGIQGFSYGVAAKLLNCYIKAFWIGDERVLSVAHPPIDRVLLEHLESCDVFESRSFWRSYKNKGWSNFSEADYKAVITKIRSSLSEHGAMWAIEKYWPGFQS